MARARKIKPGYNDSDTIVTLSFAARLLDINLWPHMDGNGMIENSPSSIKAKVFPRDDIASGQIVVLISELIRAGRLFSLEADGKRWLYRKNFRKEQKIYSDEAKKVSIDKDILDSYDNSNTLPQFTAQEFAVQSQLFATSPSTLTLTSSSPSTSNPPLVDNSEKRVDNFSVGQSSAPEGFWTKLHHKIAGRATA